MKTHNDKRIQKAQRVLGKTLIFRNAEPSDANFILSLRTDTKKSKYLSHTSQELIQQVKWLEDYAKKTDQAYFVIESSTCEQLGVVRLYDAQSDSFCWGSWILKDGAPKTAAIESALMVYSYAIDHLGFQSAHFEVRKGNENVWRFHERFGAVRVGETNNDFLYQIDQQAIYTSRLRYIKYLPTNVTVER